jgi:hypothetical protein
VMKLAHVPYEQPAPGRESLNSASENGTAAPRGLV